MLFQHALSHIRDTILPNVSNLAQTSTENLIMCLNDGLTAIHTAVHVKTEQCAIRVRTERNFFELLNRDPDILLDLLFSTLSLERYNLTATPPLDKTFDNLKRFSKPTGVLQILDVMDIKNTTYVVNEKNVFVIDPAIVYFPNAKEGEFLYISYKPKPKVYTEANMNEELDLPDALLECLYAFVASRITTGIESYKEFHNLALRDYTARIKEAMLSGAVSQQSLAVLPIQTKGFI